MGPSPIQKNSAQKSKNNPIPKYKPIGIGVLRILFPLSLRMIVNKTAGI